VTAGLFLCIKFMIDVLCCSAVLLLTKFKCNSIVLVLDYMKYFRKYCVFCKYVTVKKKVNFEIYIADRKATTCI